MKSFDRLIGLCVVFVTVVAIGCASTSTASSPNATWSVTVLGDSSDPRFAAVREATEHWNRQLSDIGVPIRFGPVEASTQRLPESVLRELSASVVARQRVQRPREMDEIPGDLVVAFSESSYLTSVGISAERFGGRALVVLRPGRLPPLSFPNVARNVAAHEIGHVLGLRHNHRPGTLMCMPPAPCRPMSYRSEAELYFPLTDEEKQYLARRWSRGARRGVSR